MRDIPTQDKQVRSTVNVKVHRDHKMPRSVSSLDQERVDHCLVRSMGEIIIDNGLNR